MRVVIVHSPGKMHFHMNDLPFTPAEPFPVALRVFCIRKSTQSGLANGIWGQNGERIAAEQIICSELFPKGKEF